MRDLHDAQRHDMPILLNAFLRPDTPLRRRRPSVALARVFPYAAKSDGMAFNGFVQDTSSRLPSTRYGDLCRNTQAENAVDRRRRAVRKNHTSI